MSYPQYYWQIWIPHTSLPYCIKMSLNFIIIWELIASLDRMFLKLSSNSNAPSADLKVLKDSLIKLIASFSMDSTSLSNHFITLAHLSLSRIEKGSKETYNKPKLEYYHLEFKIIHFCYSRYLCGNYYFNWFQLWHTCAIFI